MVDLSAGRVTPVGAGVSIAYFDPGCGTGQAAEQAFMIKDRIVAITMRVTYYIK